MLIKVDALKTLVDLIWIRFTRNYIFIAKKSCDAIYAHNPTTIGWTQKVKNHCQNVLEERKTIQHKKRESSARH